jgi:twitching motility two-component system response regulator PilH
MNYKPTVVLADSDKPFTLSVATLLEKMGFDVIPVKNGLDALSYARQFGPDVMIINKELPLIDGVDVLKEIRKDSRTSLIPVIVVSGPDDEATVTFSRSLHCTGYLAKPLSLISLNKIIYDCLSFSNVRKRRHLRIRFEQKIHLSYNSEESTGNSVTLSEGGIFIRGINPARVGENVSLNLPLKSKTMDIDGTVLYTRELYGGFFNLGPGMAIGFDAISSSDSRSIRDYLVEQLTDGILDPRYIVQ